MSIVKGCVLIMNYLCNVTVLDIVVEGEDYSLPGMMSFNSGLGDGSTLTFSVDVNADDLIEWDESIVVEILDPTKSNVVFQNNQYTTNIVDQDSKSFSQIFKWKVRSV